MGNGLQPADVMSRRDVGSTFIIRSPKQVRVPERLMLPVRLTQVLAVIASCMSSSPGKEAVNSRFAQPPVADSHYPLAAAAPRAFGPDGFEAVRSKRQPFEKRALLDQSVRRYRRGSSAVQIEQLPPSQPNQKFRKFLIFLDVDAAIAPSFGRIPDPIRKSAA